MRVYETIADWQKVLSLVERKIDYYDEWRSSGHRPQRIALEAVPAPPVKSRRTRSAIPR